MLAAAQRIFFNLRNTMAGSDQSIIDEVEAGENHIKAKFEAVLGRRRIAARRKQVVTPGPCVDQGRPRPDARY